jgi:hypothetical protein
MDMLAPTCMPLATIQSMINTCHGLDNLQGIAMPRNYISANVGMGKATNLDQPSPNPTRAESPTQIVHLYLFGPCKQSWTILLWRVCGRTVWTVRQGNSLMICACFVDDVHHCINDLSMYSSFRNRFEKRFDLKSDHYVQVYLGK